MRQLGTGDADLHREYREELCAQRAPDAIATATRVVFVLNMAFVGLDAYAYPEHFWNFLAARMTLNVALAGIYFWLRQRHPMLSQSLLCFATGSLLLWVIYGAGAPMGEYYVGLVLAAVGLPVLLPMSASQIAPIWSLFVLVFAASPLFADAFVWKTYAIHTLFLASGAFTGVTSAAFMEAARLRDFAQRREIEAARDHLKEMDRVKSRFTANVHHELRTPLTLTLAPLEAILGGEFGDVPEVLRSYLKTMHVNALRLLKLINNLLDLAKVEGQQMALHRRELDVGRAVEDLVAGARPLADRKDVTLTCEVEDGLPPAYVDPDALEKIVVNLMGNALKFTDSGGRVDLAVRADGDGLRLEVRDTGIGLPADQLDRIFDRFAQVDSSATRKHEGTGIGLSLVREFAELHGGRVWAESEGVGHGTRMQVALPLGEPDDAEAEEALRHEDGRALSAGQAIDALAAEFDLSSGDSTDFQLVEMERSVSRWESAGQGASNAPDGSARPPVHQPEIVVAEDNLDMRRLFGTLLRPSYRVRLTTNGREALEAVRERTPDLVLTDVMMPEMSGTELCRALKSDPDTESIPVMLVTSKADREMKIEGLELGADDYVTKPFHPRELMARVGALVRTHALQQELASRNERLIETLEALSAAQSQLVESERRAAVGELAAGVAHEVNNPVNFSLNAARALGGYVKDVSEVCRRIGEFHWDDAAKVARDLEALHELQMSMDLPDVAASLDELAEIIGEGLERIGSLVGDLRDFAAPGNRARSRIDVRRNLDSTATLLRARCREKGVALEMNFADTVPIVRGDAGALNQVLLNVLKNALEASGRDSTIRVEAHGDEAWTTVEVHDQGPGLDDAVAGDLFKPFVTTKAAGGGSGLGLSISRRILQEHGGTIELVNGASGGAVARIRLPTEERTAGETSS